MAEHAISSLNMIRSADRIALAYSGGKDSTTLLVVLTKIQEKIPESEIIAVTLEEGVNAASDRRYTLSLATQILGVEHVSTSFQDLYGVTLDEIHSRAKELNSPLSTCAYCGVLRRQGLNMIARRINADNLAFGHNLDDELQSMMMNLIRGDIQRLSRVSPVLNGVEGWLVPRIKPLYMIHEVEIAQYAQDLQVPFYKCPCPYGSESLRTEIREWLNAMETLHPGTKNHLMTNLYRVIDVIKTDGSSSFLRCKRCGEPTSRKFCSVCEHLKKLAFSEMFE
jgi:uncharacterized protein (TIGR00269 family)